MAEEVQQQLFRNFLNSLWVPSVPWALIDESAQQNCYTELLYNFSHSSPRSFACKVAVPWWSTGELLLLLSLSMLTWILFGNVQVQRNKKSSRKSVLTSHGRKDEAVSWSCLVECDLLEMLTEQEIDEFLDEWKMCLFVSLNKGLKFSCRKEHPAGWAYNRMSSPSSSC